MENFIEKLKTVDKKVWIGVGIGAAVVIILIVALIIGLGNNKPTGSNQGGSQNGTQYGTETEGGATEVFGSEGLGTEVIGTEMATETEMGTETEVTESESQTQGVGGTTVTQNPDVNGVEQKPTTTDGTTGMGTADSPYDINPDGNTMRFTTYSIPANGSAHYNIMKTVGKYFIIEDADAYVVYKGKRYDAKNGRVSFLVTDSKALPTDYLSFEIGNKSSTEKTFTVRLSDPTGTQANPTKIDNVASSGTSFDVSLSSGNSAGHYHKYTAQSTGQIKFYISAFSSKTSGAEGVITVNVIKPGDIVTQYNFNADGTYSVDENGNKYIVADVEAGNTIEIIIGAQIPGSNKYPAAEITWVAQYM